MMAAPHSNGAGPIPLTTLKFTRPLVFWPPAVVLVFALAASLVDFRDFLAAATTANTWILDHFGWLFSLSSFAAVILMASIFVSPLGGVRIGGANAKPLLKRWNWFAITLCTTIATGILFWGTAEPLFHFNDPPGFAHADGRTEPAATFALSTLYMHWAITPYSIYAVPGLAFALAYYNLNSSYSLSGPLSVVFGRFARGPGGAVIDAAALFALVAGVAASLGAGVMTLAGGLGAITGLGDGVVIRLAITGAIVATYVASSISGLQRGIKFLSDINIRFFFLLVVFVLLAGPTAAILRLGAESVFAYGRDFLPRSLNLGLGADAEWSRDWTIFYYANWLAWAPITALFLGRISVGYTVREFILFNLVLPAAFGMAWMTIFGGATLNLDAATGGVLTAALNAEGPEAVMYALLDRLPLTAFFAAAFVFTTFISFVTAMDSNTHSIASVCLKVRRQTDEVKGEGLWIKIFWGVLIGAVAWVMTATNGVDGIRMLSNLGGAPGLLILIGCGAVLIRLAMIGPERLNAVD
jgi:choline-glycine betaine transporter